MTVVLPNKYHIREDLEKKGVECQSEAQALRSDIRALRIGILNIMPMAETYEMNLLYPLGRSIIQIEPVWIKLKTHAYKSSNKEHLDSYYVTFEDAINDKPLDGLIVTGAPVEEIEYKDVRYWDEITTILNYARYNINTTLGICWGGLALAKMLGIEKTSYEKKLFGIFDTKNLDLEHPITRDLDDSFWCPQSRHSGIPDDVMEKAAEDGIINLLAHSDEAGYVIAESSDKKFLMHFGHPEYNTNRLIEEFYRDREKGRPDVEQPKHLDVENPLNRWRSHCLEFFAQWIKYVYDFIRTQE